MDFNTFLTWITSTQASNFSTFIQGITAAGAALFGLFSFNKWMKQRALEKRSDYAEQSLSYLDNAHEELVNLLKKPFTDEWEDTFNEIKSSFGLARRKAHYLKSDSLNEKFHQYEEVLLSVEKHHTARNDDLYNAHDKANADNQLATALDTIIPLYKKIADQLLDISLLSA